MLERDPPYLPLDDAAPGLPGSTYGLSKWLSEEMCSSFSSRTGISTLVLRPVLVLDDEGWERFASFDELPPARGKAWHCAVFVDVVDVARAIASAVALDDPPAHARMLLCADEVASERTTAELVAEKLPDVAWRGAPPGGRAALIDCAVARDVLAWKPAVGWDHRLRYRAGVPRGRG
jgi:nucleoside-diphosphate-sugar epimerase